MHPPTLLRRLPPAPLAALTLALLAACQGNGVPTGPRPLDGTGALAVRAGVQAAAYRVQAEAHPYTPVDVAGVVLTLHVLSSPDAESAAIATSPTLAPAAFATPFVFSHLKLGTTFRVRGTAYDAGATVISRPSPSYLDILIANDDAPVVGNLAIRLQDALFDGTATSGGFGSPIPASQPYASPSDPPAFALQP